MRRELIAFLEPTQAAFNWLMIRWPKLSSLRTTGEQHKSIAYPESLQSLAHGQHFISNPLDRARETKNQAKLFRGIFGVGCGHPPPFPAKSPVTIRSKRGQRGEAQERGKNSKTSLRIGHTVTLYPSFKACVF